MVNEALVRTIKNGWSLLAAAFIALAAAGGAMIAAEPPARPAPAIAAEALPADDVVTAPAIPAASSPRRKVDERPPASLGTGFVIKRILPISGPIRYGEWHWDDANVPDGPIVVTVDLEARVLSVFRGGYEIGATAVLLGTDDKPTPLGVFPIIQKQRHHISNLYDAEMPFMQRLTNDGITLHATDVEIGYASHGCIGMPGPFAERLFGVTKLGDRVFITRGKMVGMGDSLVEG